MTVVMNSGFCVYSCPVWGGSPPSSNLVVSEAWAEGAGRVSVLRNSHCTPLNSLIAGHLALGKVAVRLSSFTSSLSSVICILD